MKETQCKEGKVKAKRSPNTKLLRYKIDGSNIINQRRFKRLVIELDTTARKDVLLKSVPRIIRKYFIQEFKQYLNIVP